MKSSLMILIIVLFAALASNGFCIQASSKSSVSIKKPMDSTTKPVTPGFTTAPATPQFLPFPACASDVYQVAVPAVGYEDVNDWCMNKIGETRGDKIVRHAYVCAGGKPIGPYSCPMGSKLVSTPFKNVSMGYECISETRFNRGDLRCSSGFVLNDWNRYTAVSETPNHPNDTPTSDDDEWFYSCDIPHDTLREIQDRSGDSSICEAPAIFLGGDRTICCGYLE